LQIRAASSIIVGAILKPRGFPEEGEIVGEVIEINDGKVIIKTAGLLVVQVDESTAASLRNCKGDLVGLCVINGEVRWRRIERG